ncbi:MAG: imidazole glycerol phosphate synthase subunit HisF [Alphaproteobacteria bacterium]|jgi:cyclase|nr:imidazole glycerol phosphate synthase subunit HisF [Alphaproteobacteria bacterium]
MLKPRRIPVLQILNRRLVKTVCFKNPTYIGDPLNAVKIFNDKEVDELIILDISPNRFEGKLDYEYIELLLSECQMPVGYGGGIQNSEDAQRIIGLGAEKIIINSLAFENPKEVEKISEEYGAQAVSLSLDYTVNIFGKHVFYKRGGREKVKISIDAVSELINKVKCGEIILHSIKNDGQFSGLDYSLLEALKSKIDIPIVMCGGARSNQDIETAIQKGAHSIAAGSKFIYQGPHKAVLIQY